MALPHAVLYCRLRPGHHLSQSPAMMCMRSTARAPHCLSSHSASVYTGVQKIYSRSGRLGSQFNVPAGSLGTSFICQIGRGDRTQNPVGVGLGSQVRPSPETSGYSPSANFVSRCKRQKLPQIPALKAWIPYRPYPSKSAARNHQP